VQRSALLPTLIESVPPDSVLRTLEGIDPLPILPQLIPRDLPEPDPSVLRSPGARSAARSVVKVEGSSCGLGIQGSGWVVRRTLVATNAHVISGERDTRVLTPDGASLAATVVYRDAGDDVAILRVPGLTTPVLETDDSDDFPRPVVLLGYPGDGALVAVAATAGSPRRMLVPDADDRGVGLRRVVPLRGRVRRGESGGPVVDAKGRVRAMIFGGTRGGNDGFAVPVDAVLGALDGPLQPVDPGPCAG
jgi:S1-C subfamily serine protease